jgi:hypothetical protein
MEDNPKNIWTSEKRNGKQPKICVFLLMEDSLIKNGRQPKTNERKKNERRPKKK